MTLWLIGNTTIRNPYHLRDGLTVLATTSFQGNLQGKGAETELIKYIEKIYLDSLGTDELNSVGRKWRSAMCKLGFLFPDLSKFVEIEQNSFGRPFHITKSGWRLIEAETVPAIQECFLRSLSALLFPSPSEQNAKIKPFSPLIHTLNIMLELESRTKENSVSFSEFSLFIQTSTPENGIKTIVNSILEFRTDRGKSENKKNFDSTIRNKFAKEINKQSTTFNDYADTNIRYLKATGLVQSKGRGLALVPEKRFLINELVKTQIEFKSLLSYYLTLCDGAALPTDNFDTAKLVLLDLYRQAKERNIYIDDSVLLLSDVSKIELARYNLEAIIFEQKEEQFAREQVGQWEEIVKYMDLLIHKKRSNVKEEDGENIKIPTSEAPAYFEWTLWRAFLAINSLINKPSEARRFKIDQDFLPIGTAAGGGPDMIFEFEGFVVVVEVTLTESSRQEAAEGEPVRRHVADLMIKHAPKIVYGLFIALKIDSNTAETFRIGVWYGKNDERMALDIVPFTLEQFKLFFVALFQNDNVDVQFIKTILDRCCQIRTQHEAPLWKLEIDKSIVGILGDISQVSK